MVVEKEAQIDGGSNSHIFTDKRYFHMITNTTGLITQVMGDQGKYTGIGIVLEKMGDTVIPL